MMSTDDWFRGPAWDEAAKQLFRTKLSRTKTQKYFYLRMKAEAIAGGHPSEALALLDEYIAADKVHRPGGQYAKSIIYLQQGKTESALACLDMAIGKSGMDMQAPALLDFVFLVGLHDQSKYYQRALWLLNTLDELAQKEVGRPFNRNFQGNAGAAFINHALGKEEDAKQHAKAALALAAAKTGPIPSHPHLGRVPQLPDSMLNRLIVIAGTWDDKELGPRPEN